MILTREQDDVLLREAGHPTLTAQERVEEGIYAEETARPAGEFGWLSGAATVTVRVDRPRPVLVRLLVPVGALTVTQADQLFRLTEPYRVWVADLSKQDGDRWRAVPTTQAEVEFLGDEDLLDLRFAAYAPHVGLDVPDPVPPRPVTVRSVKCEICGKGFRPLRANRTTCSNPCYKKKYYRAKQSTITFTSPPKRSIKKAPPTTTKGSLKTAPTAQ